MGKVFGKFHRSRFIMLAYGIYDEFVNCGFSTHQVKVRHHKRPCRHHILILRKERIHSLFIFFRFRKREIHDKGIKASLIRSDEKLSRRKYSSFFRAERNLFSRHFFRRRCHDERRIDGMIS